MIISENCGYCMHQLRCKYKADFKELVLELQKAYYNKADGTMQKVADDFAKIKIECPEHMR